jgi:hypothetical protein
VYTVVREGPPIPAIVDDLAERLARALEGRYELRGLLGHGGMGAVFLAAELRLDRLVAIKVLPPSLSLDHELLTRFEREAKTAARLDHAGIVPIYSVEDIDGLYFFVMKFVPGTDLGHEIESGPMAVDRARELLWESAVALGHAHRRGVIHRDVKPGNIMIDPSGRAVLTDFGIAKAMSSGPQMTSTGQMIGTPQYMSPEQMQGAEVDGRADQYSLGMVAYHMLAGRQPFEQGSVAALLVKQLGEYPESLASIRPDVPDAIVAAIERAIRKDPEERFESMDAFAEAIWPERAGSLTMSGSLPAPAGVARGAGSTGTEGGAKRFMMGAAAVVLMAAAGAVGYSALSRDAPDPSTGAAQIQTEVEAPGSEIAGVGPGAAAGQSGSVEDVSAGGTDVARGQSLDPSSRDAEVPAPVEVTTADAAITLPPPESESLPAAEPATGFLTVNAQPVFAFVAIDGVELPSSTPIFQHPLSPGIHIVTVRREGYETISDTVEITAGNVTRRNHVLISN